MAKNLNLHANINKFWPVLAVAAVAIGAAAAIQNAPSLPIMFRFVDDKMNSIITPKPPLIGGPAVRDLRGTWASALSKKGMQVYGKFTTGPAITTIYEDGDMEFVIDTVTDNTASGKIRYTNMCATSVTTAPKIKAITVKKCFDDTGYRPMTIRVSGAQLDFGTFVTQGVTYAMRGTYTEDIMTGSMTVDYPGYGTMKGEFHLMRKS